MKSGLVPQAPIFVDSPLATRASAVFEHHAREIEHGDVLLEAFRSSQVRFTESVEQSRAISRLRGFHVIIAASGMCEAGRIRHHLKQWLWSSRANILLVGYQAQGTLGRILHDGARRVRIQGEEIEVKARIGSLDLYSGHADGSDLHTWISQRLPIRHELFLTHGEPNAIEGLRNRVADLLAAEHVITPELDRAYELTPAGAREIETERMHRVSPGEMGRLDWHNDLSKLLLDISQTIEKEADERNRAKAIRRLRKALVEE